MATITDAGQDKIRQGAVDSVALKFLRDVWSIVEMKVLFLGQGWYWFAIRPLVFPLGVLFWLQVMVPDDPEVGITTSVFKLKSSPIVSLLVLPSSIY